ncbi:MAG: hypothetical protein ABR548_15505 [Actinomycetota bacterium]|nr:hypothetical protein [Actinomycetota bacterium]
MRFRTGMIVGFGAGYVMGSKAGRSRYEQIRQASSTVWESDPGRKVRESAHRAMEEVQDKALGLLHSMRSGGAETIDLTERPVDQRATDALYR